MTLISRAALILFSAASMVASVSVAAQDTPSPSPAVRPRPADRRPRIALALGGGGALGFAHIGVIEVLEENNIPIGAVSGTSMGAVVGAFYSLGYTPGQLKAIMKRKSMLAMVVNRYGRRELSPEDRLNQQSFLAWLNFDPEMHGMGFNGLMQGTAINNFFDYSFWNAGQYRDFKSFPRAYSCVATDIYANEKVVFTSGSLSAAVRASMAIPTVVTPVRTADGRVLLDGGLSDNLPVEEARNLGADVVIAVDLHRDRGLADDLKKGKRPDALSGLIDMLLSNERERSVASRRMADVVIQPKFTSDDSSFSFDQNHIDKFIQMGRDAATEALPLLRRYAVSESTVIEHTPIETIPIDKVVLEGFPDEALAHALLGVKAPALVSRNDMVKAMRRLSNHGLERNMRYYYLDKTLYVSGEDASGYTFGYRLGYDTDFGLRTGVGTTVRRFSKPLSFDFHTTLDYMSGIDWQGRFTLYPNVLQKVGVYTSWQIRDNFNGSFTTPDHYVMPLQRSPSLYRDDVGLTASINDSMYARGFFRVEHIMTKAMNLEESPYAGAPARYTATSWHASYTIDTLDNDMHPTTGVLLDIGLMGGTPPFAAGFGGFTVRGTVATPIVDGFGVSVSSNFGMAGGPDLPANYFISIGGLYDEETRFSMPGYKANGIYGRSLWSMSGRIYYSILSRLHVIGQWSGAFVSPEIVPKLTLSNFYQSAGGGVAVDLPIGSVDTGVYYNFNVKRVYMVASIGTRYK